MEIFFSHASSSADIVTSAYQDSFLAQVFLRNADLKATYIVDE